ncbi:hypothetical protein [Mycobacterium sp. MS1601]|uniref:hypothetical protein n=1 Tax=Mycobacterium sp. MS1601 TaxID=1936029 RepID=UPI001F26FE9A|nr:hypothetical protein [Mycobacterium sp. MS1601]
MTNVTTVKSDPDKIEEQTEPEATSEVTAEAAPAQEPQPASASPAPQQRVWKMPTPPAHRVDQFGRAAVKVLTALGTAIAAVARFVGHGIARLWHAVEAIPASLQLFCAAVLALLFGLAGAIALDNALGLMCTVVVIPVSALALGALGQRWYGGNRIESAGRPAEPAHSDLQRSVEYVDKKLAVALNSFGTERHQQAVIALFQAKTAVELTLGTEQDGAGAIDIPVPADDLRPRIRVGSASKSLLRESNSMAAS